MLHEEKNLIEERGGRRARRETHLPKNEEAEELNLLLLKTIQENRRNDLRALHATVDIVSHVSGEGDVAVLDEGAQSRPAGAPVCPAEPGAKSFLQHKIALNDGRAYGIFF